MHFCPHCGKELPGRVSFCPYCGGEIGRRAVAPFGGVGSGASPAIETPPPEHKKKAGKLYKEWVKFADLPPAAVPSMETPKETPVRRDVPAGRGQNLQRLPLLYILLAVIVIVFGGISVVLLMQNC